MSRRSGELLGLLLLIGACSDTRDIPPPCEQLAFDACSGGFVELDTIKEGTVVPEGIDALAATGDILLANDRMIAVIDALDHPDYLSPTGGAVLDLVTRDSQDSLNHLFQGTGLLPGDAPFYTSMQFLSGDNYRAVIVRGTLAGHPKSTIVTRYEVRPCEPGFRMRTEVVNGDPDAAIWTVTDAWYWGGRSVLPFTPYPGAGFVHPDFKLTTVNDVFRDVPYLAASGHSAPGTNSAYAEVACSADTLSGFHATTISAMGTKRRIVEPRDSIVFERFVGVAKGDAIEPAVAIAADVRRRLFGEAYAVLAGKVVGSTTARVIVSDSTGTPWSETLPASDGTYTLTVPANRSLKVEAQAFGRMVASVDAQAGSAPDLVLPPIGRVELAVAVDGRADEALVFFHPADDATREAVTGKFLGNFGECAPLLGPPHGSSPACNRVLVGGRSSIEAPPGRYDVYASAGPFATLARATIEVRANETSSVALALERLPINPSGTLTADFHVHGGASFDSSIPDVDRVRAFLASGIDVIAATDHDIVSDYGAAIDALHARERIALMTGVETTGQILWNFVPDQYIPKVIGHWNFWPLPFRPTGPRNGAPIDELVEPYVLFDRARALGLPASGVIQLNHPITDAELGRDLGYVTAIEQKLTEPPVPLLQRNLGYDTQEVMNGTDNDHFLTYRAYWFYLLNRGIARAATANSDSHGLTDNVLGTPRNVVWTRVQRDRFEPAAFNADVKRGRIVGTNGPMIEAWTTAADGSTRAPSIEAFMPAADAQLHLRVSAAPWVPIDEVRVVINGAVVKTIAQPELVGMGSDPFSREGLVRYEGSVPLAPLLPASGDSWLVIEAGAPILMTADLNCDGIPDTGDNNGDGVIDWKDVDRDDPIDDAPDECDPDQEVGPLPKPPMLSRDAAGYHFQAVTPGSYPIAFTNPFLFGAWGAK